MPTEHYRPNGDLSQGYYCGRCGQPAGMYGHSGKCTPNHALVAQLRRANPRPPNKPVFRVKGE